MWIRDFPLFALICMVLLGLSCVTVRAEVQEAIEQMSLEDLHQKLSAMKGRDVKEKDYPTRESAIREIRHIEETLKDEAAFESEVKAAAEKRRLGMGDHLHAVLIEADSKSIYQLKKQKEHWAKLIENYEDLEFAFEVFKAEADHRMKANLLQYGSYAVLGLGIVGDALPLPAMIKNFLRTRRILVFSTFMMMSTLSNTMSTTGAFEVYVDDVLVYSGLKTGAVLSEAKLRRLLLEQTLLQDYS